MHCQRLKYVLKEADPSRCTACSGSGELVGRWTHWAPNWISLQDQGQFSDQVFLPFMLHPMVILSAFTHCCTKIQVMATARNILNWLFVVVDVHNQSNPEAQQPVQPLSHVNQHSTASRKSHQEATNLHRTWFYSCTSQDLAYGPEVSHRSQIICAAPIYYPDTNYEYLAISNVLPKSKHEGELSQRQAK